jgi:hypothetical protein
MSEGAQAGRPPTAATNPSTTSYVATCLTHHSAADFEETRRRMDDRVPLLEPAATVEVVLGGAPWSEVEAVVTRTAGPTGLVALARLDSNLPRRYTRRSESRSSRMRNGVHVAYDQPSSIFKSLGSQAVDRIAVELDEEIRVAVEDACR